MDNVIIPAPDSEYVELARDRHYSGQRWRKHILTMGNLIHPATGETLKLDDDFYSKLVSNFDRKVCPIVQVPLADGNNRHVETVTQNAGEVMGISRDGNKIYVDLDIRDPKVQDGLKNRTILGASAFLHMNYTDTRTGRKVGPTLLHSCMTNRPYVTDLDDYEPVVAATMADSTDSEGEVIVLSQEEAVPEITQDQAIAALKEFGIDVEALQAAAAQQADMSTLTAALTNALGTSSPDSDEVSLSDVVQAVAQISQANVELSSQVEGLKASAAEAEVDRLVSDGYVMPKQKAAFIKLALTDRDMFTEMLPSEPVIKMSAQEGATDPDPESKHQTDVDSEIARLSALVGEQAAVKGARIKK